jgi:NADH-quinone oxidoreductase subunit J
MEYLLFYLLAGIILFCALFVVFNRSPVGSALFLVLLFFTFAGIYLLLDAEFIAVIQVLVYAGAIMVLFLFVIMLLNLEKEKKEWLWGHHWQKTFGIIFALAILPTLVLAIASGLGTGGEATLGVEGETYTQMIERVGNTRAIAGMLFTKYVLPFEITSVLLLATMVGVGYMARKEND